MDGSVKAIAAYLVVTAILAFAQGLENRYGAEPYFKAPVWWMAAAWPGLLVWQLVRNVRAGRWL